MFLKLNFFVWFFVGFGYLAKQSDQLKVLQKLNIIILLYVYWKAFGVVIIQHVLERIVHRK